MAARNNPSNKVKTLPQLDSYLTSFYNVIMEGEFGAMQKKLILGGQTYPNEEVELAQALDTLQQWLTDVKGVQQQLEALINVVKGAVAVDQDIAPAVDRLNALIQEAPTSTLRDKLSWECTTPTL